MLEIFLLVYLCKHLYKTAEQKGYPGVVFAIVMAVSWFVGGIGGGIAGMESDGAADEIIPLGFITGYLAGVATAVVGNLILVSLLPDTGQSNRPNPAYDERVRQAWEEQAWIERRRRGEAAADDEVVPLAPARPPVAPPSSGAAPPIARPASAPRAKRAWKPRWTS